MSFNVLDTDTLSLYQVGHAAVVRNVLAQLATDLAVSVITIEELLTGWYTKLRRAKKRDQLARAYQRLTDAVRLLTNFELLSFTEPAILRYEQLRKAHRHASKNDLRIAAIVLENTGTLVTRNTTDFQGIKGLRLADWSK